MLSARTILQLASIFTVAMTSHMAFAQSIPIPARTPGYLVGQANAPLQITAYYDLACPDSAAAAPVLNALSSKYGSNLAIRYVVLPLPYHIAAFPAAQMSQVVASLGGSRAAWTSAIFNAQAAYFNTALQGTTPPQLAANMTTLAAAKLGLPAAALAAGMANTDLNEAARIEWKSAVAAGVSGTPAFFVNGVLSGAESTWTEKQWEQLLDPLLGAPNAAA